MIGRLLAPLLLCLAYPATAQNDRMENLPDASRDGLAPKQWREGGVEFPDAPDADRLVLVDGVADPGYEVYVDPESVSLGADRVTRYTVAVVTATGASNTFYEGVRCDARETKTYAYATRAGRFRTLGGARWKKLIAVSNRGARGYRRPVAEQYLCTPEDSPRDPKHVRERLGTLGTAEKGAWNTQADK
jgi:hypothetical protein